MQNFIVSDKNDDVIGTIECAIKDLTTNFNGSLERINCDERTYLSFDIPDNYSEYFKQDLISTICRSLIFKVKEQYFTRNMPFRLNNLYAFILLKSLVFADFQLSVDFLQKNLSTFHDFYLDGIENFMLRDDFEEWEEISRVTNDNTYVLTKKSGYKRFLRCITSSIDSKHDTLYLIGDTDLALVTEDLSNVNYSFAHIEKHLTKEQLIVATLIENFPKKLVIYSKNLSEELSIALEILFDNSISKDD